MARDEFSRQVVDRVAKRAGMRCSSPDCRAPTSGPGADPSSVTNTGVAAHICAASPGGPRYDESQSAEERSGITNAVWLCQTHAKLVDDDEFTYPTSLLLEWKETAELMAALEARGYEVRRASSFAQLEDKAPKLLMEMRTDLRSQPLVREFILLSNRVTYWSGATPHFTYYYEDHEYLNSLATILVHHGAIYDVAFNKVPRYNFTEEFVRYLIGDGLPESP
jgi:hypothetical protein